MKLSGPLFVRVVMSAVPLFCLCVSVSASDAPTPTREKIVERIHVLTGLDALFEIDSIDNVPASVANIPLMRKELEGKTAIKVVFKRGRLRLKTARSEDVADKYERQFVVLLDSSVAHLLSVISSGPEDNPDLHREPPEKVERMIRHHGELYESLPTSDPMVTFLNALEIIQKDGVRSPLASQEIEGFYVIHSQFDLQFNRPKSAKWIISLRGGGVNPIMPADLPNWARSRTREFVDATSGKWLGATSFP